MGSRKPNNRKLSLTLILFFEEGSIIFIFSRFSNVILVSSLTTLFVDNSHLLPTIVIPIFELSVVSLIIYIQFFISSNESLSPIIYIIIIPSNELYNFLLIL